MAGATATFTSDFRYEFAAETDRLLRKRFLWFSGIFSALGFLGLLAIALSLTGVLNAPYSAVDGLVGILWVLIYSIGFCYAYARRPTGKTLLSLTVWVVLLDGLLNVAMRAYGSPIGMGLFGFMLSHTLAALFLPWSPKQALKPVIPVLVISALSRLFIEPPRVFGATQAQIMNMGFAIAFSLLAGLPGTTIAWLRYSRRLETHKLRFLHSRYTDIRRELVDARRIHESLFPDPIEEGTVRFCYCYEPMRQIGGDFLFAAPVVVGDGEQRGLNAVLLDVTGHGIAAALTVNRIHGEIQRLFAEDPDTDPGTVLRLLNRYVHLTLAIHSVYLTAFCLRVDPVRGTLEYASGGHPPAFLRSVDGKLEHLPSTSFVLGACADRDFDPEPRTIPFEPGDTLIAYTDGATEARDHTGRMLGIKGLQAMMVGDDAPKPGGWSEHLLDRLSEFRFGPPADDTLIIEVFRPLNTGPKTRGAVGASVAGARGA